MKKLLLLLATSLLGLSALADQDRQELNIYTDRPLKMLRPIADGFETRMNVTVNIVRLKYSEILERLEYYKNKEGEEDPSDLIFVKDLVYLNELADKGFFQPMEARFVEDSIPASRRHPEGLWTAVSMRPRTLVYNKEKVKAGELKSYSDLADPKWKNKLCLRTSRSSYNLALISFLIADLGYDKASEVLEGWMENLNQSPKKNDRAVLDAMAAGECEVGVVNSYYLAGKLNLNPEFPVGIVFANQESGGVHVNGTGIGVSASSEKVELASAFIDMLMSDITQQYISSTHLDYPAKKELMPSTFVADWGSYLTSDINWYELGALRLQASELIKKLAYE